MMCNASQAAAGGSCPGLLAPADSQQLVPDPTGPVSPSLWPGSVGGVDLGATRPPEVENLINFVLWVVWALTVFGNVLVLSVIVRDRELHRKPANLFILNLSSSDLLVGLVSMTFLNVWRIRGEWIFGEFVCKAWTTLDFAATTQSALAVALISFDRFMLVYTGLKYKQHITLAKAALLILLAWCFSLVVNAVPVLLSDGLLERWVAYEVECDFAVMYELGYQVATFLLSFALPFVLVAFFNLMVYNNIRRRAKRFQSARMGTVNNNASTGGSSSGGGGGSSGGSTHRNSQGRSMADYRKHRKAAVTLALIVGVFLVCWVPYWINKLLVILSMSWPVPALDSDALAYLLWSNSAVNPFLYAVTNPRIRSGMVDTLRRPLPGRFARQSRRQRTMEYNMGETNMTKITRQDGD